jgi:acetoin:2,6-dichlorophenolindophenol oxidoreductase subunit alpha
MTQTATIPGALPAGVSAERFAEGFRWMLLSRTVEDKIAALYHAGKIVGGVYLGRGQEAFSAALAMALEKGRDIFAPLIRDQAGRMAFGDSVLSTLRTYLGSVLGPMRGRDGNIHRGEPRKGMPAMISHLGAMVSVVCGMLMARRFKGETDVVGAATIGDGGTSTGAWHEAMNMAAVERLPLVVAVANNQFAYSTPNNRQFACEDLSSRALGYGFTGYSIDGTDLGQCIATFDAAVAKARAGEGPQLVVGRLLRLCGHGEHDDAAYVPGELRTLAENRDCLKAARAAMLENGWASPRELELMEAEAYEQVQQAVAQAQREPLPDPARESWMPLASDWLMEGTPHTA